MRKRSIPMYLFLNCLTFGIYGFVVAYQMGREIDALCKGDRQQPAVGYVAAAFIRLIPIFGPIYYNYWWYQQANRLKLNANRYGLTVKESGTDAFLMRTAMEIPFLLVTLLEFALSLFCPGLLIAFLVYMAYSAKSYGFLVFAYILEIIFLNIWLFFSAELSVGANVCNCYLIKNLNRFAAVYRRGARPFDPMAYEDYPAMSVKYPLVLARVMAPPPQPKIPETPPPPPPPPPPPYKGKLIGVSGPWAGYEFDLPSGEEIIVGKDAKVAQVVIATAYKEVSRKHLGVCYDLIQDQYRAVDYSSNGTWANGEKMERGKEVILPHGTELKLANDKNVFRLQ